MSEFDEDDDIDRLEDVGEFELKDNDDNNNGASQKTARKLIVKRRLTVKQQLAGLESDECDRYLAPVDKQKFATTGGASGMGLSG